MTQVTSWRFHLGDDEPPTGQQKSHQFTVKKRPSGTHVATLAYVGNTVSRGENTIYKWQTTSQKRIMENPKSWLQNFLFGSCSVLILNIEFTSWDCIWKGLKNFFRIWLCRHYPGLARTVNMQIDEWGLLYDAIILRLYQYYIYDIIIRQYRHRWSVHPIT